MSDANSYAAARGGEPVSHSRRNFGKQAVAAAIGTGAALVAKGQFDGDTIDGKRDTVRLSKQLKRIFDLMQDEQFRTLSQISRATSIPEASASARLRDLRKERNGGHDIEKENLGGGLWQYRLVKAIPPGQIGLL